ncbi:outer membrane receptor protein involved in Fe transport [Mucilaginibacter gracilis]|uniref:Outer membrane receptor protein involved in Fe transport n=1 Tax=Mucilaginibacter gracilis TaxID=423350 RepID=A0A495J8K8_9SPHI|nr:outer membrane beta-barrel protein [Mucilaginibacter gracilis]RKR84792.1 outer membrane receptor protein involved in Fe transport [Mucilaginibacter gracilis]
MKTFKLVLITIWLCLAQNFAQAQTNTAKISGLVLDKAQKPIDGASVTLIAAKNSATVKAVLANADGSFLFDNLAAGNYCIAVTTMGYSTYRGTPINTGTGQAIKLPAIILVQTSKALQEVAITEQKNFVEHKIDRTVVNVNALISNTGANALEVLEKSPGVVVDENGNISFKGKGGVMVMIDDKPTYLSGENLANYLKAIPASQLDQIELMSNPPAKYDASGSAGVINIKTKKSKDAGFNGTFAASVGRAKYWRTLESLNLNYHVNNINLFANMGYGVGNNYRRLDVTRTYLNGQGNITSGYLETAFFHPMSYNPNIKMGMDYYLSPKTTFGVVLTGMFTTGRNTNPVNSFITDSKGKTDSAIIAYNTTRSKFYNKGGNLNYNHQFEQKGHELSFNLDYLNYNSGRTQSFSNSSYNNAGVLGSQQNITDDLPANINIYAAKTDYAKPLSAKGKFESGLKTSYVNTDNAAYYFNVLNNVSTVDNNNSNHFIYKENINAAYVNFNKEYKRFSAQFGLRAENTNVSGHQLGNAQSPDSAFTQHYTSLFPTGYVLYKLDTAGSHTLNLSYGRRIDRPYYQDLNPFVTILDKYSQFEGNPFLKPQFASEYQLTYGYKSCFSLTVDYNVINDYQVEYDMQKGDIFLATTMNLGQRVHWAFEIYWALKPVKWFNFTLNGELDHNQFSGQLVNSFINNSTTYLYVNEVNQFNFTNGWAAELSAFYLSPARDAQFTHIYREQINVGISKKVLNNKGTIKLSARDIFKGNYSAGNITNIPNVLATYHNDNGNRSVTAGFTYNFGTTPKNEKRRNSSAESEQDRVRN